MRLPSGSSGTIARMTEAEATFAFGVWLRLTTTDEGGRRTPLLEGFRRQRALPVPTQLGFASDDAAGADRRPVLAFSRENIAPGDAPELYA